MLRVACSRVVPCAFRAAASPRIVSPRINDAFDIPTVPDRHFSTCSGNRKVVRALKSAIESHDLARMKSMGLSANIPFTVYDDPGYMHMMMKRELDEEKIEVTVNPIHNLPKEDDEGKNSVYINVSISKEKKGTLDLGAHVSADADEIVVDRVSFSEPHTYVEIVRYMMEKEGDVQDSFGEFLRIRGIEKCNVGFLFNYMLQKRQGWGTVWTPGSKPETDDLENLKVPKVRSDLPFKSEDIPEQPIIPFERGFQSEKNVRVGGDAGSPVYSYHYNPIEYATDDGAYVDVGGDGANVDGDGGDCDGGYSGDCGGSGGDGGGGGGD